MTPAAVLELERVLWPKGYRRDIWMILDCARDPRLFGLMLESRLEFSCLYNGSPLAPLESVAPHLVKLEYDDPSSRRLLERSLGDHRGILLKCDSHLVQVRRHLRQLLTVRGPDGVLLLFRFYDPRVLRVYLPTCYPAELRTVFGPVERYWAEDESSTSLIEFAVAEGGLTRTERPLAREQPALLHSAAVT